MYVVLGATGNIGSQVVETLKSKGQAVIAVAHDQTKVSTLTDASVEGVSVDVANAELFGISCEEAVGHSSSIRQRAQQRTPTRRNSGPPALSRKPWKAPASKRFSSHPPTALSKVTAWAICRSCGNSSD